MKLSRKRSRDGHLRGQKRPVTYANRKRNRAGRPTVNAKRRQVVKKRAATSSLPPSRTLGGVKPPPSVSVGGGFKNRGADCFVIAVVQALVCLDPFIEGLGHDEVCCKLLVGAANHVRGRSETEHSLEGLREACGFSGNRQEDAHEFLVSLLGVLNSECSSTTECFESDVNNVMVCNSCTEVTSKPEKYHHFSLDISHLSSMASAGSKSGESSVSGLLCNLFGAEQVKHRCSDCGHDSAASSRHFTQPPKILALHAKRFEYIRPTPRSEGYTQKLHHEIDVPLELPVPDSLTQYRLRSIVRHHGDSPNSGHYTTVIIPRTDAADGTQCTVYNDTFVEQKRYADVSADLRKDAYLLFYERLDTEAASDVGPHTGTRNARKRSRDGHWHGQKRALKSQRC